AGWTVDSVDLFEVNEAFSGIEGVRRELGIPDDRFNVNGGAVALGHPIGASGARLLVTLLYALRARGKRRGIVSLCLGGGEGLAPAGGGLLAARPRPGSGRRVRFPAR